MASTKSEVLGYVSRLGIEDEEQLVKMADLIQALALCEVADALQRLAAAVERGGK
jgi:hypothetical protein